MNTRASMAATLAVAALVASGSPHAATPDERIEDWVGRVDRPDPSGHREIAGTCIASDADPCHAAISVLRDEQSGLRSVLATRALHALDGSRPGGRQPLSLVTDAWEVAALEDPANEVSVGLCQRHGVDDPRVVAVIRPDVDTQWYVAFERLWRLDAQGRLQPLPADGVRCLNEGYGYEG
jgi:hypothetical protein